MVAISLYRGKLHQVPSVPRRWEMPLRVMTVTRFKFLRYKRQKAIISLVPPKPPVPPSPDHKQVNAEDEQKKKPRKEAALEDAAEINIKIRFSFLFLFWEGKVFICMDAVLDQEDAIGCDGVASGSRLGEPKVEKEDAGVATCGINCSGEVKNEVLRIAAQPKEIIVFEAIKQLYRNIVTQNPQGGPLIVLESEKWRYDSTRNRGEDRNVQHYQNVTISTSERINELEKKLDVLNEKKHNLVQMLKQIINAEEDMKKRIYLQSSVPRPPIPQTEVSPETESGSRHVAPRLNVDVNFGSDQAGDSGYPSSHSTHAHTQPWTSPSAFSPHSRPLHGSFLHNLGLPVTRTGSLSTIGPQTSTPSPRVALAHQGHPVNLPPISLSGAQYMTSSSSPASAGT